MNKMERLKTIFGVTALALMGVTVFLPGIILFFNGVG